MTALSLVQTCYLLITLTISWTLLIQSPYALGRIAISYLYNYCVWQLHLEPYQALWNLFPQGAGKEGKYPCLTNADVDIWGRNRLCFLPDQTQGQTLWQLSKPMFFLWPEVTVWQQINCTAVQAISIELGGAYWQKNRTILALIKAKVWQIKTS